MLNVEYSPCQLLNLNTELADHVCLSVRPSVHPHVGRVLKNAHVLADNPCESGELLVNDRLYSFSIVESPYENVLYKQDL